MPTGPQGEKRSTVPNTAAVEVGKIATGRDKKAVTHNFEITTTPEVMARIEGLMAMLHYNSAWGHSGTFAIWMDGDGPERVIIRRDDADAGFLHLRQGVSKVGDVGYDVEMADSGRFTGRFTNWHKESKWTFDKSGNRIDYQIDEETGEGRWVIIEKDRST